MSSIKLLLATDEYVAPDRKVITKILVDGLTASFCAKSLISDEADVAVNGIYAVSDASAISALPVILEGRFSNVYNATGSANLRLVEEDA